MDDNKRADQFLLTNIRLYDKINVIHLTDIKSNDQIESKFIRNIQENINKKDQTIVISSNKQSSVLK